MSKKRPYITYNGSIGVRVSFLVSDVDLADDKSLRLLTYEALKKRAARTPGLRLREGKGKGNEALFSFENIDPEWKELLVEMFGDPKSVIKQSYFLDEFYERDYKASNFYNLHTLANGESLDEDLKFTYTTNASVLNAVIKAMSMRKSYRKALGHTTDGVKTVWELVQEDVEAVRAKHKHTLRIPSLRRILNAYKKNGYEALISGKLGNQNTAKVVSKEQQVILEGLLKKHNKFDNMQIAAMYSQIAGPMGWKSISSGTVAKYRKELDLYISSGNSGATNFRNTRNMQVKRKAPNMPMVYWTLDGWDAELVYQETGLNRDGRTVTTYHNRPTVVLVLDPYLKYPVGYAIGTHETPQLIKQALRNAVNHTAELFGRRYKTLQLQSDQYGKGALTPIYEALSKHYTPARVKNAKAKVIEPYFKEMNKGLQMLPNWSGFGITARKENQPNTEYLNKIRHQIPNYSGVCDQLIQYIEARRMSLQAEYVERFHQMADEDHLPLSDMEYLDLFGETTGYTNRLEPSGLNITIEGNKFTYDSHDLTLRENRFMDWCIKYDPEDLTKVLAVNATSDKGRLLEEVGTLKLVLEHKYIQPMALYDRKDGDAKELAQVEAFNKDLEHLIVERNADHQRVLDQFFVENRELEGTLAKMMLTDSLGQHKNHKSNARMLHQAHKLEKKLDRQERVKIDNQSEDMRKAYIDSKVNVNDFLNL